jgi:hypothetical protein
MRILGIARVPGTRERRVVIDLASVALAIPLRGKRVSELLELARRRAELAHGDFGLVEKEGRNDHETLAVGIEQLGVAAQIRITEKEGSPGNTGLAAERRAGTGHDRRPGPAADQGRRWCIGHRFERLGLAQGYASVVG